MVDHAAYNDADDPSLMKTEYQVEFSDVPHVFSFAIEHMF